LCVVYKFGNGCARNEKSNERNSYYIVHF
jgi:hypothetical protein